MLFRVLGPLEVETDSGPVALTGARPRALLTALLLQPRTVVPAHRLISALWGERLPEDATNALHQAVGRLRRQLGDDVVTTHPAGYRLACSPAAVDAERFEADYQAARLLASQDLTGAEALLDSALGLWRGPAYGEFADGFARAPAARLEELRIAALQDRVALLLRRGDPEAVARARDLTAQEPLRERPVELLMRALHAGGRTAEALRVYRRYRELLADEIGLDPAPGLRELEGAILRGDVSAPAPALPPGPRPPPPPRPPHRDLPWRPGRLLGRERELHLLVGCLATQRLVTLVGPGGVGKTRLALEAAHRLAVDRQVWWADLVTTTPQRVVDALADAAGIEVPRSADAAGSLCAALAAHRGVLLLDNAEHLLPELAPVVERLADAAPDLTILATSRERIGVAPEHVHFLTPLPLPTENDRDNPAVRLFVDRTAGLEAASLSDDDVRVVSGLCRRLDGLPLAIELGAARAATFGLRELAARLDERLELLAGARRTAAARHRTLRTLVDWSYGLLTDDEARLFARLTVFPSGFTLAQVEAVGTDERIAGPSVPALLARLVEQSMVQSGQGRYWLLETLRVYGAERLDAADGHRLRARHARDTAARLASLAPQLSTADEAAAVGAIAGLDADLHAAWAHAVEHDRALAVQLAADVYDYAYHRQRREQLEWGLVVSTWDVAHPKLPIALAAAAAAAWSAGRLAAAQVLADRAAAADTPCAARAVNQCANLANFDGRTEEAVGRFSAAAALHRAAGESVRALACEISVSLALAYAGRFADAAVRMPDLLDRADAAGNPSTLAWAHFVTGEAAVDNDHARAAYAAASGHATLVDNRLFGNLARTSTLRLAVRHGRADVALTDARRVVDQWEDLRNEAAQWSVLLIVAVLLVRVGATRAGAVLAGAVLAARDRQVSIARDGALLHDTLGRVRQQLGTTPTEHALAEGAGLPVAAAVAHARREIRTALQILGIPSAAVVG
jgi:predicted ATPase/DNA-binding SARP family transcriptional activator